MEIVTRYLDLIYYIDQDVLMIGLPGSKPSEDQDKRFWYGLKNARNKYTTQRLEKDTQSQIQEIMTNTTSIEISPGSLEKIARELENIIQKPVMVDIRLLQSLQKGEKKEFFISARDQNLQEILTQFCQSHGIAWIIEGNTIYFTLPEYLTPLQASQEKKIKQQERINNIWKAALSSRILFPLPKYSLPQIIDHVRNQWKIDLVVAPELWQDQEAIYSFKEKSVSLKELLEYLAKENRAAYILGENNCIYFISEDL